MNEFSHKVIRPLSLASRHSGGRSRTGRITSFHRGGGNRSRFRLVDFHRSLLDVPGVVIRIQKDPGRTAPLALVCYFNGVLSYVVSPRGVKVGSPIISSRTFFSTLPSFSAPLVNVPLGTLVHCVEQLPGKGASFVRSAGTSAQILKKFKFYSLLRLRSGEHRFFPNRSFVSVGSVGFEQHKFSSLTKAGQSRWLGIRPTVRGEAMNPVDHPHGGNTSGGRHPQTPWGRLTRGVRTRHSPPNSFIFKSRHVN